MKGLIRAICQLTAVLLLGFGLVSTDGQEALQQSDVVFEGLNAEYGSCDPLRFTVRNISQTKIYVEVYAEESKSGEWGDADFPFDLTDPRSLYIKRVGLGPNTMGPGTATSATYDRCLKPNFVKGTDKAYSQSIKKRDAGNTSSVLQRLRADVYYFDGGAEDKLQVDRYHLQVRHKWSKTFERVPEKRPAPSTKSTKSSRS
jgi:hypothetical protein